MFTCAKIRNGSTYLNIHLSANDYYAEGEQVVGVWLGKGAELLGIEGHFIGKDDPAFEALRMNQHPDGSGQLTPRNPRNGIWFYDFQCSAQKSVSILAVTLGDHRLVQAHDLATQSAQPSLSISLPPFRSWWGSLRTKGLFFLSRFREGLTSPQKIPEPVLTRRMISLDSGLEL